jgi:hypothetical protein
MVRSSRFFFGGDSDESGDQRLRGVTGHGAISARCFGANRRVFRLRVNRFMRWFAGLADSPKLAASGRDGRISQSQADV